MEPSEDSRFFLGLSSSGRLEMGLAKWLPAAVLFTLSACLEISEVVMFVLPPKASKGNPRDHMDRVGRTMYRVLFTGEVCELEAKPCRCSEKTP